MSENWHLDKKVPIALVSALLFQTMTMVWWASKIDSKADNLNVRLTTIETTRPVNIERLSRLETEYQSSKADTLRRLDRMENKVDMILDRLPTR